MAAGERRSYSGNAVTTAPTANFNSAATGCSVVDPTGYPDGTTGPFFIQVDDEIIKVAGRSGAVLSFQTVPVTGRGWDGTTAASHTTSSTVQHVYTKTDADEANEHYSSTAIDQHTHYLNTARHDTTTRHPASVLPLGSPGNSAPGDTANAGVASSVARSDHRHGREADSITRKGVTLEAASFSVPINSVTPITWATETVDTSGYITVSSSTITIPAGLGGIYSVLVRGLWTNVFTEDRNVFFTTAAGSLPVALATPLPGLGGGYVQFWTAGLPLLLEAGDTLSIGLGHANASAQSTTAHLELYRVAA